MDLVPRMLFYVGWILAICLASTFPWWLAAQAARAEFSSLLSAFACTMRLFAYSVSLLVILVSVQSLNLAFTDPYSPLLNRTHLLGTAAITAPCAWRAFREKGLRLGLLLLLGWAFSAALALVLAWLSPVLKEEFARLPTWLAKPR